MARRDASPDDAAGDQTDTDLDAAVAGLYAGPPDAFVAERDVLVRRLRAESRRAEAAEVKALRRPRVLAWALNAGRSADPDAVAALAEAASAVAGSPSGGGDLRAAMADLRQAERAVTDAALAAAGEHDQRLDPSDVSAAVRAVVSDPDALADLLAGRLQDVPATGGLGIGFPGAAAAAPRPAARPTAPDGPEPEAELEAGATARRPRPGTRSAAGPRRTPADPARRPAAERRRAAAERAVEDAGAVADEADRAADDADAAAAEAEDVAERAAADAADAERAAEDARRRALDLARVATTARRAAAAQAKARARAESALESARKALTALDEG
jgi:hypothetical protein